MLTCSSSTEGKEPIEFFVQNVGQGHESRVDVFARPDKGI